MSASNQWNELKKQPRPYSGQKKTDTASPTNRQLTPLTNHLDRRSATAFSRGSKPDF
ncbi:MAG: hypothetical protein QGI86_04345 [Candidatus Poribacteria bacterium]|nr:hypothetical protein [Candidatus Poribacteria bacterium]MDP6745749.1 hypothetical protein [Candidatus Poribacteria bacterium]MDP6996112.1 hypothetical protein [Candidatus Poribacteria bacterium]